MPDEPKTPQEIKEWAERVWGWRGCYDGVRINILAMSCGTPHVFHGRVVRKFLKTPGERSQTKRIKEVQARV